MSKIRLSGSNSGYVEIAAAADAGNLTFTMPTTGTALFGNGNNVISGITTYNAALDINSSIDVSGTSVFNNDVTFDGATAGYDVVWDRSFNALEFADNAKLAIGSGTDLLIYHDGNNSLIRSGGNGQLQIESSNNTSIVMGNAGLVETIFKGSVNGAVELYFNNSKKIETTNTGAVITGICTATSFSGSGENLTRTTQLSHRNIIINGAMSVAQRATSTTGSFTTADYATCDRWKFGAYATDQLSMTITQEAMNSVNGFGNYLKMSPQTAESGGAANEYVNMRYTIEAQDCQQLQWGTLSAKSATLSFWVKSNVTGTACVNFTKNDSTSYQITRTYTINVANTWEYKTLTIPGLTASGIANDNGAGITIYWFLDAGSDYKSSNSTSWGTFSDGGYAYGHSANFIDSTSTNWNITGVQFEVGSQATPFEHRSFGDELNRCLRYYWKDKATNTNHVFAVGANYTSSNSYARLEWPVPMRGTDSGITIGYSALSDFKILGNNTTINGLSATSLQLSGRVNQYGGHLYFNGGGQLQQGGACHLRASNTNAYLSYDCEL